MCARTYVRLLSFVSSMPFLPFVLFKAFCSDEKDEMTTRGNRVVSVLFLSLFPFFSFKRGTRTRREDRERNSPPNGEWLYVRYSELPWSITFFFLFSLILRFVARKPEPFRPCLLSSSSAFSILVFSTRFPQRWLQFWKVKEIEELSLEG